MTDVGKTWRLLECGPAPAAWNMAVDEALLDCFEVGAPPILRLYRWSPAALSLGRFQPFGEIEAPPGADMVRRLSGGSAIYHREDEITYAVVAPYALFGKASPKVAYHAIHGRVAAALATLGIEADVAATSPRAAGLHGMCFDRPTDYDLCVGGRKLMGSAQRRSGKAFLQHGSLPLSTDPLTHSSTSLAELLAGTPSSEQVRDALLGAFAAFGSLQPSALDPRERARAEALQGSRYGDSAWTQAR